MSKRTRKQERIETKSPPAPKPTVMHKGQVNQSPALDGQPRRVNRGLLAGAAAALIVALTAVVLYVRAQSANSSIASPFSAGSAQYCAINSKFIQSLGFTGITALDTRSRYVKGVALRELDSNGKILNSYQDPSWSDAGYLGALQNDEFGNVYLVPVPFVSVLYNPPEKANTIWRIDTDTGKMEPFIDLPAAQPITDQSVFGLMDLTYDCDTKMLYASSVLGSAPDKVAGRIFQIDAANRTVKAIFEGLDAVGLGIFNDAEGKRLYIGHARSPEIYSLGLNPDGSFANDLRPEMSLTDVSQNYYDDRARSIVFQSQSQMVIKTLKFNFNLVAPSETRQTILVFTYDSSQKKWMLTRSQISSE